MIPSPNDSVKKLLVYWH